MLSQHLSDSIWLGPPFPLTQITTGMLNNVSEIQVKGKEYMSPHEKEIGSMSSCVAREDKIRIVEALGHTKSLPDMTTKAKATNVKHAPSRTSH